MNNPYRTRRTHMLLWANTTNTRERMLMLGVAVPNKGGLHGPSMDLLTAAGYQCERRSKELTVSDAAHGVRFHFLRPADIAGRLGEGELDVGITGEDMLAESGREVDTEPLLALGFGVSSFYFAAVVDHLPTIQDLDHLRVATSFPVLTQIGAKRAGISLDTVYLSGGVEGAIELGIADAIADVVETGNSLRAAGLEPIGEPIMRSQAVLVRSDRSMTRQQVKTLDVLARRLENVLIARRYVLMDYNCPHELLDKAAEITPGRESPTVTPLAEEGWCAVRVMVKRDDKHRVMDELWGLGAKDVIVTALESCRL